MRDLGETVRDKGKHHALIGAPQLQLQFINRDIRRRIYAIKSALTAPAGREWICAAHFLRLEQSVCGA